MAKDKKDRAVALPIVGSTSLGAGAYGVHKFDNFLSRLGLHKGLELNPEAIDAIEAYAKMRPNLADPTGFAVQYALAANNAANSQLFLNDPRKVWELEINSPELRENAYRELQKVQRTVGRMDNRLGRISGWLRGKSFNGAADKIDNLRSSARAIASSFDGVAPLETIRKARGSAYRIFGKTMAHTPEMARSPLHSYVRLLNEVASGTKTDAIADNTTEALLNFRNPKYTQYAGKRFSSPAEYFNEIQQSGMKTKIPHLFDDYISSFDDVARRYGANEAELSAHVRRLIAPNSISDPYSPIKSTALHKEVRKVIGNTSDWTFDPATGKIHVTRDIRFPSGIRTVQDIVDRAGQHAGLKFLNAQAALGYGKAGIGYGKFFNKVRILQALRSGKTKAGLLAGSLGLAGLATHNFIKNRESKKSIIDRILGR